MAKLEKLEVIETALDQYGWSIDLNAEGETVIESEVMYINGPRETDYYHTCGLYHKAGVPFEITEVRHEDYEGLEPYLEYSKSFYEASKKAIKPGTGLLVAGGFCNFVTGIIGGLQQSMKKGKKIGVVYMDAHGDMETSDMSRSHIIAGCTVSAILGLDLDQWREISGITEPIQAENFILTDYHGRAYSDDYNIARAGLKIIDERGYNDSELWTGRIKDLADRVDAIVLHIDVDIMQSKYVPAFRFPLGPGGQTPEAVIRNVKDVMATGKVAVVSFMDVCFESEREGHEITYYNASRVLGNILENWKEIPEL